MDKSPLSREEFRSYINRAVEAGVYTDEERDRIIETYDILSGTDELTGLYRKSVLERSVKRELDAMKRMESGKGMSVVYFDLNNFKAVNDTIGHQAGDEILRQFASVLNSVFSRETDLNSRNGGDEYASLLRNTDKEDVDYLLGTLGNRIERRKQAFARIARRPKYREMLEDYINVLNENKGTGEKKITLDDCIEMISKVSASAGSSYRTPKDLDKHTDTNAEKDMIMREAEIKMYADKKARGQAANPSHTRS